ncbi:MAG: VIT1/CCC1 transporter family protein [Demequinaceae bacterium]|nr:VIT1/CCC1 transporter family protein [Demequinaceae bacterium]
MSSDPKPTKRATPSPDIEEVEEEEKRISRRLNALRAAVLGANDGIVSIAALVVGVAAAKPEFSVIATAGFAGLAAGALSMAVGEYISVHSQRDAEEAQLERERHWHQARPDWELDQLTRLHTESGMSKATARKAAKEQTAHDPLAAHARAHLGIDPDELVSPVQAGLASLIAFTIGGTAPILSILCASESVRIPLTFGVVVVALAGTGFLSARAARARYPRAIARNVIGGSLAMAITYGIGGLVGTAV